MRTQSQNEKISEILFGAREGCVGLDRLFCITLTLVSLAKSYASLISCIGSLASGRSVGFWHGSGIPAQQEDSAEDMMQEKGWHRRKECPKFEEIGAPAKGG